MENATPKRRVPYVERLTLALLLPRFVIIGHMALMGSFGVVIASVMGVRRYASTPVNPFAVYADVMPGQPSHAIDAHDFTCWLRDHTYYDQAEMHCRLQPETGAFSRVEAVYSKDLIQRLSFDIRDDALTMGDLAVLLDLSDIRVHGQVFFTWRGNIGVAQIVKPYEHFSLYRPVWQVTLTDARLHKP